MIKRIVRGLEFRLSNYWVLIRRIILKHKISANFIIIDDFFPNPLSDWRLREFDNYLDLIPDTKILFIPRTSDSQYFTDKTKFDRDNYYLGKPEHRNKIIDIKRYTILKCNLAYCLFYHNLREAFPYFYRYKISFVFTLYPGGGFKIYNEEFDKELLNYLNSDLCSQVIVNMPFVYDYLTDRLNVNPNKITLIYGVPIVSPVIKKLEFTKKPEPLRVIFSSHKYMQFGLDKGFDIFNGVAKSLEDNLKFAFTVVGGFKEDDLLYSSKNIRFLDELDIEELQFEYSTHDVILSPNRSFVLGNGAFDGFPTGSVMHAGLNGCLMLITDDLDNSTKLDFKESHDYYRISCNVTEISNLLVNLEDDREKIRRVAISGREKLSQLLDLENQLMKRNEIIQRYIKNK